MRFSKQRIAWILFILLCLTAVSALAENVGVVNAKVVLRTSANKESKALQTLPKGDEVVIVNSSGEWYKVHYGNFTGFVMKKYVNTSKSSGAASGDKISALGVAPGPMKIGDVNDDVEKLQKALNILGYYDGRIDGSYGKGTTEAVQAYQKDKRMEADGVAGRQTVKAIFGSVGKELPRTLEAKTSSAAPAKSSKTYPAVSSIKEIGSTPEGSKQGDSGTKVVKLQQALECLGYYAGDIDGNYGGKTVEAVKRLQKKRGMKQDGVAGSGTIRVLFGETQKAEKTEKKAEESKTKTETPDWYADNMTRVIPKNAKFTIKDVRTGKTFTAVRWSGSNHLDAEPASAEDTKTMKSIFGGSWSWKRRAILIKYNGHVYAASMNGMPHGTTVVSGNGYDGHFCVHFKNSKTHGTEKIDADHQIAVTAAGRASW